jgi:hypothetical protein
MVNKMLFSRSEGACCILTIYECPIKVAPILGNQHEVGKRPDLLCKPDDRDVSFRNVG